MPLQHMTYGPHATARALVAAFKSFLNNNSCSILCKKFNFKKHDCNQPILKESASTRSMKLSSNGPT